MKSLKERFARPCEARVVQRPPMECAVALYPGTAAVRVHAYAADIPASASSSAGQPFPE